MSLAQSQPCVCPVPLSHLLRMMTSPPESTPPKGVVRRSPYNDKETLDAERRKTNTQKTSETRAKYVAVLSKTKWFSTADIAAALHVTPTAASRIMACEYMDHLVLRKKAKRCGVTMCVWRLK